MRRRPLEQARILDLTMYWAGPAASGLLCDMGAEVIKIEPRGHHLDLLRFGPGPAARRDLAKGREDLLDFRVHFNGVNRGKLGTTLDFASDSGRSLFMELVSASDVVVDNFGSGSSERLGIDYQSLRAIRPDIIVASSNMAGNSGPWREMRGNAGNMQGLSGLTSLLGYADDEQPTGDLWAYCDFTGAEVLAYAILLALVHRQRTGAGQWIDTSASDSTAMMLCEPIMDAIMNHRSAQPMENAHATLAPHGIYRCAGEDEWISIAVDGGDEWRKLCEAMGRPDLEHDERIADKYLRVRNRQEIDAIIGEWCSDQTKQCVFERLQWAGVAAAPVLSIRERKQDPQLDARGCFTVTTHTKLGMQTIYGNPWKLERTPPEVRSGAPCVGEHNGYVVSGLLGLSEEQASALAKVKVL